MRILIVILLSLCLAMPDANAQWKWARGNTGAGVDGWGIATDQEGNVFIAGEAGLFNLTDVLIGPYSFPLSGYLSKCLVAKYDGSGNILWATLADHGSTQLINVATDRDGDLFLFGSLDSKSVQIGSTILTNANYPQPQYFLIKFDPNGNVIWAKSEGEGHGGLSEILSPVQTVGGVTTDLSGNVYVTSDFASASIKIGSNTLMNSGIAGTEDVFVAKYNSSGDLLWARDIGGAKDDDVEGITVTSTGQIYITGGFKSPFIKVDAMEISNSSAHFETFVVELDAGGNIIWGAAGNSNDGNYSVGLAADFEENIYVTGIASGDNMAFSDLTFANPIPGKSVQYLVKLEPNHHVAWNKIIQSVSKKDIMAYSISTSPCGVWVCGTMRPDDSTFEDLTEITVDGHIVAAPDSSLDPIFIAGFDLGGNFLDGQSLASGADDQNEISCDRFGNVFVCSDYAGNKPFVVGPDALPVARPNEFLYVAKYQPARGMPASKNTAHTLCIGMDTIMAPSAMHSHYIWTDGQLSQSHGIADTGTFRVNGFDSCASYDVDTIRVVKCDCGTALFVPNAFTPNGDGKDDIFYPRSGPGVTRINSFRVYNRWGELVFERKDLAPNDVSNAWDGTYKGQAPLSEVFVWTVEATCEKGTINKKGSITVIR